MSRRWASSIIRLKTPTEPCWKKSASAGRENRWRWDNGCIGKPADTGWARAQQSLAVGDGAPWIWHLIEQRWKDAQQVLDFYHASQHLQVLAEALHPTDEPARQRWVDQQCHDLRQGKQKELLQRLGRLPDGQGPAGDVIRREKNYFQSHRQRLNYQALSRRGWPIGSGAVESACAQRQRRFKRPGQFWTTEGLRRLNALIEARDLNHWDHLWAN
jgi:hypothetical protein